MNAWRLARKFARKALVPFHEPHKGVDRSDPRASALFQLERNTRRGAVWPVRSTIPPETLIPLTRQTILAATHAHFSDPHRRTHNACARIQKKLLKRKRNIYKKKKETCINIAMSQIQQHFFPFLCDTWDYFKHERNVSIIYNNN